MLKWPWCYFFALSYLSFLYIHVYIIYFGCQSLENCLIKFPPQKCVRNFLWKCLCPECAFRRDSNPQFQNTSGSITTPQTARMLGPAHQTIPHPNLMLPYYSISNQYLPCAVISLSSLSDVSLVSPAIVMISKFIVLSRYTVKILCNNL